MSHHGGERHSPGRPASTGRSRSRANAADLRGDCGGRSKSDNRLDCLRVPSGIRRLLDGAGAPPEPPPAWTGSVGAGLGLTSGNSNTKNFNLAFAAVYDPKTKNLFKTEGFYLWGQADGETNVDKGGIGFRYERKLSDRAYFYAELPYLRDRFKGITYLISPTVGVGVKAVKTDTALIAAFVMKF